MLKCYATTASKHTWAVEQTNYTNNLQGERCAGMYTFFLLKIKNKIKNLSSEAGGAQGIFCNDYNSLVSP